MIQQVGVVGAGAMGMGIANSAARGGFKVAIRDVDPAREQLARESALEVMSSPAAIGRQCDAIFIVVVDAGQIDEVLGGPQGLLSALPPGKLVLFCSTFSPVDSARFAAAIVATGAAVLDAPISGGPARAQAGTMSMMLAGTPATLEHAKALLDALQAKVAALVSSERQTALAKVEERWERRRTPRARRAADDGTDFGQFGAELDVR